MTTENLYDNFLGIPPEFSSYDRAKIVLMPVPFDKTCSWLSGTEHGPQAAIEASKNLELYEIETKSEPYRHGIYTAEPLCGSTPEEINSGSYQRTKDYLAAGKFVVTLGGEHSISYGPIKAHAERYKDLSILQLDAHTDLRDSYGGTRFSHACIMARAQEMASNIVQVGIRSMDASELENARRSTIFYAHDLHRSQSWMSEVVSKLSNNVYVTLDVDVFEIGLMPSTGTPEPGGLGWYDVAELLKLVAKEREIVGLDVVELAPNDINKAPDFLVAKLIYKILAYRFSSRR